MEAQATEQKKVIAETSLTLESFIPVNEYLLCRELELPTHTKGGIVIAEPSRKQWGGRAEIVLVSENLNSLLNKYSAGQQIIYSKGANVMDIWVDEEPMILLHKGQVGAIIKK